MKKNLLIFIIFAIANVILCQNYYPLKKSNSWHYNETGTSLTKDVRVISDSMFINGKRYSILSEPDLTLKMYVRVDSQYIYYYDINQSKEIPYFKLNGKIGDTTWVGGHGWLYTQITDIDSAEILNTKVRLIHFIISSNTISKITFSDNFGPISASYYDDPPAPWPNYSYNLLGCIINGKKYSEPVSVKSKDNIPDEMKLFQNYPNPFNPSTVITYQIPKTSIVQLKIYDMLGREVTTLVDEEKSAGNYTCKFNGVNLPSGVYFYKIKAGNFSAAKKLMLLK